MQRAIIEDATVVGSGAVLTAGTAASLATTIAAIGLTLPLWVFPVVGIGSFLCGGIATFLAKDKILNKANEDAKSIEVS